MKTSHLTALLIAAITAVLLTPSSATAGHESCTPSARLVGYHSCGAPIYLVPRVCGYHPCGLPRYSWRREIRHTGCRCSKRGDKHHGHHHHYGSRSSLGYTSGHYRRSYCPTDRYRSSGSRFSVSFGW